MLGTLGALEYVIDGLKVLPGRKSVMLFSSALSLADYSFEAGAPAEAETSYTAREINTAMVGNLRRLTDLANRASVVLYTIDPRGIAVPGVTGAEIAAYNRNRQETQAGMDTLAKETGGLFLRNSNDLAWSARQVASDQKGYYLLGYVPDHRPAAAKTAPKPGAPPPLFHVSVKVKRPGVHTRSRTAYQGSLDAEEAPPSAGNQMLSAAMSPFAPSDVAVRLTPVLLRDGKDGYVVRSFLHVDGKAITFKEAAKGGPRTASLQVMTAAIGDNGIVVDQMASEVPLRVAADHLERLKEMGLIVTINMPVRKAGVYQVRAVVRDGASGHQGSARQFLPIPPRKKDRLALSGIILTGVPKGAASIDDEDPDASHAVRRFKPGGDLLFGVVAYEAKRGADPAKPAVDMTLRLYRDNQLLASDKAVTLVSPPPPMPKPVKGKKPLAPPAGQALVGSFHLSSKVEPGEYAVELVAKDPLGKPPYDVAVQRVGFEVVAPAAAPLP
jgi:hypothetical protein